MNEHRMKILQMLSAGQVTAEEAERLISAVEKGPEPEDSAASPKPKPKYIRVEVKPVEGSLSRGPNVNVRVPMQLLRAGVRLASLIPVQACGPVNRRVARPGHPNRLVAVEAGEP